MTSHSEYLITSAHSPACHSNSSKRTARKQSEKSKKSLKMCSYLLAFAVGAFEVVTGATKNSLPVDVIAVKVKRTHGLSAWNGHQGDRIVQRIYKCEIPSSRFSDDVFPVFPVQCDGKLLISESREIFHETVHQWASDITSSLCWNTIWRNEWFKTIIPFISLSEIHLEFCMMGKFKNESFDVAFKFDWSSYMHLIHVEIKSEDEINSILDDILLYSKACCFIRKFFG